MYDEKYFLSVLQETLLRDKNPNKLMAAMMMSSKRA